MKVYKSKTQATSFYINYMDIKPSGSILGIHRADDGEIYTGYLDWHPSYKHAPEGYKKTNWLDLLVTLGISKGRVEQVVERGLDAHRAAKLLEENNRV